MCKSSFPSVAELNSHIGQFLLTGFCQKNYIGPPPKPINKQKTAKITQKAAAPQRNNAVLPPAAKPMGPATKKKKLQEDVKRPRDPSHKGTCAYCKQGKIELWKYSAIRSYMYIWFSRKDGGREWVQLTAHLERGIVKTKCFHPILMAFLI